MWAEPLIVHKKYSSVSEASDYVGDLLEMVQVAACIYESGSRMSFPAVSVSVPPWHERWRLSRAC